MIKPHAPIKKILIANRGEIACRVIKTARKMGIATVAVYSDADRKALHVRMADEAVHIGPSPAVESYLVIDKIITAATNSGADAIHPGYGFLSENPDFVRACHKAGIIFIGPSPESMEAMGLKDAAKKIMDAANVPTTPGYHGEDQSPKNLQSQARMIGYPVLIKAVAGGGGKGMRKVETEADFGAALASCQREAKSSFGNDNVLIEKYITSPRHIEVQVFGDHHGHVVHMFERDCSVQRRHQKVIEEAPAPGMTDDVRKAMTDAAINAAKAVNYVGAGTVEFIVDGSGKLRSDGFWFMEMNTRLQVEHPVTEMITGLDLVELQIRIAQGEKLPAQKDIKINGHAVEARLYAEDPANDFLPSIGTIEHIETGSETGKTGSYRVDAGVESGDRVTIFYDPMIAKAICHSDNREDSLQGLRRLIDDVKAVGVKTNAAFLDRCLANNDFKTGKISTHFIAQNFHNIIPPTLEDNINMFALAALTEHFKPSHSHLSPFKEKTGFRVNLPRRNIYRYAHNEDIITAELLSQNGAQYSVKINDERRVSVCLREHSTSQPNEDVTLDYKAWSRKIFPDKIRFYRNAQIIEISKISFDTLNTASSANTLTALMPGKIIAINAVAGDAVKAGDTLIIMEAMKMEMALDAPRDGVIAKINAAVDALVADGDILLALETDSGTVS
jgi:3-methylcrotonyl-CoA carboxylase alpha subunit